MIAALKATNPTVIRITHLPTGLDTKAFRVLASPEKSQASQPTAGANIYPTCTARRNQALPNLSSWACRVLFLMLNSLVNEVPSFIALAARAWRWATKSKFPDKPNSTFILSWVPIFIPCMAWIAVALSTPSKDLARLRITWLGLLFNISSKAFWVMPKCLAKAADSRPAIVIRLVRPPEAISELIPISCRTAPKPRVWDREGASLPKAPIRLVKSATLGAELAPLLPNSFNADPIEFKATSKRWPLVSANMVLIRPSWSDTSSAPPLKSSPKATTALSTTWVKPASSALATPNFPPILPISSKSCKEVRVSKVSRVFL